MDTSELGDLWGKTLRSAIPTTDQFDRLARSVLETFATGDTRFLRHINNRSDRVMARTGQHFDAENFDLAMARAFVADEMGFRSWDELNGAVNDRSPGARPMLFHYAVAAMDMGNFSSLETTIGGPAHFHDRIVDWHENGLFDDEPETLAEIFAASCMLGHAKTAEYLLDKGVDPYAGMKTGLAGFHYAVSGGRLDVTRLLIDRKVPVGIRNMYGGTVFEQALWSAINEHSPNHASIIEALIESGVEIETGTLDWWETQEAPSDETKKRVADALRQIAV